MEIAVYILYSSNRCLSVSQFCFLETNETLSFLFQNGLVKQKSVFLTVYVWSTWAGFLKDHWHCLVGCLATVTLSKTCSHGVEMFVTMCMTWLGNSWSTWPFGLGLLCCVGLWTLSSSVCHSSVGVLTLCKHITRNTWLQLFLSFQGIINTGFWQGFMRTPFVIPTCLY